MVQRTHPEIPLLILTAFHDKDMESNLLRLRVRQVLAKPIEAAALTQAIEDALATPEQVA
jgi:DNA-binding NarL/FixJ family response regulator